jgi:hypothetical protein
MAHKNFFIIIITAAILAGATMAFPAGQYFESVTAGSATTNGDITINPDKTGGNALAKNELSGLPRIKLVGIGTMANGTTNTVITDIGDSETPATKWTAIDADVTMSNDSVNYRQGTASLKFAFGTGVDATDGAINTLSSGNQDWSNDESVGFWARPSIAFAAGDLKFGITDSVAGETLTSIPALTANKWQWVEVDISGVANASKDVVTDVTIEAAAAGVTKILAGSNVTLNVDFIVKWDGAEEETLGAGILQDGVLSVTVVDATDTGSTSSTLTEYTDYFVHYQSGDDAIVFITDQSGADKIGLVLIAY